MSAASAATLDADRFPLAPHLPDQSTYYFTAGEQWTDNAERRTFPDLAAARAHALQKANELLWQCPYRIQAQPEWKISVFDDGGRLLLQLSLCDALDRQRIRHSSN